MANVGSGDSGKTLIGTGNGKGPTYASIGTNSGLTDHGVVVSQGNGAFVATVVGTAGQVLTSNGAGSDPTYQSVSAAGAITTVTGNTGGAQTPSAGNFNVLGTGSITIAGTANTETVQLTGLTNHTVLVGAGTATITKVGPGSSGQILQSGGASADPAYSTATYPSTATGTDTVLRASGTNWVPTSAFKVSSTDVMTNTAQPVFLGYLGSTVTNVTGNASNFTLGTTTGLTEVFDQGNNLSNATFTAPVTGKYLFSVAAYITGCTIMTTTSIQIITSNRTYAITCGRGASSTDNTGHLCVVADMDINDTFTCVVNSAGEAGATDDVFGSANPPTFMCGFLIG
jgi:hypothetical protein